MNKIKQLFSDIVYIIRMEIEYRRKLCELKRLLRDIDRL